MAVPVAIDRATATQLLRAAAPDWEWLLAHIESEGGRLRFPAVVKRAIENLKIHEYPRLYENEHALALFMCSAFMSNEEIADLCKEIEEAPLEDRGEFIKQMVEQDSALDAAFTFPKSVAEEKRALAQFNAISESERAESINAAQRLWSGFLAVFHQYLSVMVHGEKLTALVSQAKAGNDDAFFKSVQIDKRILTIVPYFKKRFEDESSAGNQDFLDGLSYRLKCPPYRGKIRYKSLWMAFSILDSVGLLETLKHQEILELCDQAGIGGFDNRIEDVKYLTKRIAEFRTFRERGVIASTP